MKNNNDFLLLLRAYFHVLEQELQCGDKKFLEEQLGLVTKKVIRYFLFFLPKVKSYSNNNIFENIDSKIKEIQGSEPFRFVLEQYNKLFLTALHTSQSEDFVHIILRNMNMILCQISREENRESFLNAFFNQYYVMLEKCLKNGKNYEAIQIIYYFLANFIEGIDIGRIDYRIEYEVIFRNYFRFLGQLIISNNSYEVFSSFCEICSRTSPQDNTKHNFFYREFSFFAALSIFKNQISNINAIWQAKQPDDSVVQYAGFDLFPSNITELIISFIKPTSLLGSISSLEGKHDSRKYLAWYFSLILMKINRHHLFETDIILDVKNFGIRQLHEILSIIQFVKKSINDNQVFSKLANNLDFGENDIKNGNDILNDLEISINVREKELLQKGSISNKWVTKYKERFLNAFTSFAIFRMLHLVDTPKIDYSLKDDIAVFYEETGANYLNAGEPLGLELAEQENNQVIKYLITNDNICHYPLNDFFEINYPMGKAIAILGEEIRWDFHSSGIKYVNQKAIGNFQSCGTFQLKNTKILTLQTPCGVHLEGILLFVTDDDEFNFSKLENEKNISEYVKICVNKIPNTESVLITVTIEKSSGLSHIKVLYYEDIERI